MLAWMHRLSRCNDKGTKGTKCLSGEGSEASA